MSNHSVSDSRGFGPNRASGFAVRSIACHLSELRFRRQGSRLVAATSRTEFEGSFRVPSATLKRNLALSVARNVISVLTGRFVLAKRWP